ncbi:hypothetical protein ACWGTO_09850 [Mesorhizobium sp. PL10]
MVEDIRRFAATAFVEMVHGLSRARHDAERSEAAGPISSPKSTALITLVDIHSSAFLWEKTETTPVLKI